MDSLSQRQGCFCTQLFQQRIHIQRQIWKRLGVLRKALDKLFVDLSSPYHVRLRILKYFWGIGQDRAYGYAQVGLLDAFRLLYTKLKIAGFATDTEMASGLNSYGRLKFRCRQLIMFSRVVLPLVSIGLFHLHQSHSEAARKNDTIDVKITYAIFSCTAVLEFFSGFPIIFEEMASSVSLHASPEQKWPEKVAQYSLIGYFASNKRHSKWMCIAGIFGCKDFVDQRMLCMEPCSSSARISGLVLGYTKEGWKKEIHDAPSYCRFNDHSRHWLLLLGYLEGHHVGLSSSMRKRPFDECVLLWHIATDICFFSSPTVSEHRCAFAEVQTAWKKISSLEFLLWFRRTRNNEQQYQCGQELTPCRAVLCRQMSNYMVYLLFVNPEMLLPGTRRNLFTDACDVLDNMLKVMDTDKDIPIGKKWNTKEGRWVMERVISTMQNRSNKASEPCSEEEPKKVSQERSSSNNKKSNKKGGRSKEDLVDEAWALAQWLLNSNKGDEKKMWEEIQCVWVEMLCFSASRCRGYLHAKALGEGGEFLSYVWLMLFYMGMETFTDKLQRQEQDLLPSHESAGSNAATATPSTSEVVSSTTSTAASASNVHTNTGAGTAPSASEICMTEDDMV